MPKGIRNKFTDTTALGALFTADPGSGGGAPEATSPAAGARPTEPATGDEGTPEDLGDAGKQAIERMKRDKRAAEKRASEAEAKLQELADKDKTEVERLAARATSNETKATEAERRATRLEVILDKLPETATAADVKRLVALSKRLVGETREELEADADELLSTFQTTPATPGRPAGDIGQGPRTPAQIADPRARDLAQIEADLKAGARR